MEQIRALLSTAGDVKDIAGRRDPRAESTVRSNVRIDLSMGIREEAARNVQDILHTIQ